MGFAILEAGNGLSCTETGIHDHKHNRKMGLNFEKGPEGVKWELESAFFRGWKMGFYALGLGFMIMKTILWNLNWDFNKIMAGKMRLGSPPNCGVGTFFLKF